MRKIKSQEEIERVERRNRFLVGSVMIFLLLFSIGGYALIGGNNSGNSGDQVSGNSGVENSGYTVLQKGNQIFYFVNSPEMIDGIPVEITIDDSAFSGNEIYLDIGNGGSNIASELGNNLKGIVSKLQEACYGSCERNIPEKECSGEDYIIVFKTSEERKVYQDNKCVFIEGDISSVDAFLYKLLGFN